MKRWRRIVRTLLLLGLVTLALLGAGYVYLTRPAQLRTSLLAALADRGIPVRHVGPMRYNAFQGLVFHDLELLLDELPGAVTPDRPSASPTVWTIGTGRLELPLIDLLRGNRVPRSIVLERARLGLVRPDLSDRDDRAAAADFDRTFAWVRDLPRIEASETEVFLYEPGPARMLKRRMRFDLTCETVGDAVVADLRQTGGSVGSNQGGAIPGLTIRFDGERFAGQIEALDLDLLNPLLPDALRHEIAALGLVGRVGCPTWTYDPRDGAITATVAVTGAGLVVPIEPDEYEGERFAHLRDTTLRIDARGNLHKLMLDAVECAGRANLRGGAISGTLRLGKVPVDGSRFDPLGGAYELDLAIRDLVLPNRRTFPAFVDSQRLHLEARSILQKYAPDGAVNFTLRMACDRPGDKPSVSGVLEALGPRARYQAFPYPVRDTRGTVRFDDSGIDLDLHCRHGSATLGISGHVNNSSKHTGFALRVFGRNVPLDRELYAALPESYQELWRRAAPLGMADIDATIDRDEGTPESGPLDERVTVDARLLGGSISFEQQRITHCDALLRIRGGRIDIEDFYGYIDDAGIACHGTLGADEAAGDHVSLRAAGMALDQDARDESQPFQYSGRGDVWGSVGGSEPDTYVARLRAGELHGMHAQEGWDVQRGWVQRRDGVQQVLGLEARRGERWLKIDGNFAEGSGPTGKLTLQAGDPQIGNLLRQIVPTEWEHARNMLGLDGQGTIRLNLSELAPQQTQAEVWLTADAMRPQPIPVPLRNITGHALLGTGGFELYEARATCGQGTIAVNGQGAWTDRERWTRIAVQADDLTLNDEFIRAMPAPLDRLLEELGLEGKLRTVARRLQLEQGGDGTWTANGHLRVSDANLSVGLELTAFTGELDGTVRVPPQGGFLADSRFVIERGTLSGRRITNWSGHLRRTPDSTRLHIDDLQGSICGGAVTGSLSFEPADGTYEVSLTLRDVQAAGLLEPGADDARLSGVLHGHVFLRGNRNAAESRVGGGTLRISEAPVSASRLTAEIAAATKRESKPLGDLIKQAEIRFAWEGDLVRLQRVELRTPRLRLVGSGAWNTRTDALRVTMVGSTPEGLRLAIISDLVDAAGQELLQYRITGTSENPDVQVRPLHTITDPLRALLRGG